MFAPEGFAPTFFFLSKFENRTKPNVCRRGKELVRIVRPNKSIIILIGIVIDNVEEPKLINPLTGAHNPQPISQLLLLQEFLRPIIQNHFLSA